MDANYEIPRSKSEEKFVKSFEEEEKYNLTVLNPNPVPTDGIFFYKPVNGVVSSHYEADARHFGVDLVAAPKESVLATLDGTVVFLSLIHILEIACQKKEVSRHLSG